MAECRWDLSQLRKLCSGDSEEFRMLDCKEIATPMASNLKLMSDTSIETVDAMMYHRMIGSLMYLMNTRSNICFALNTLSQFLMDPRHLHLIAAKHVLRYLKGTVDYGLKYDANKNIILHGYVDSDWPSSAIDRKSTSGYCFSFGYGMISWFNMKQSCMVLSTTKAEYVAACSAICEAIWLWKLLFDLFNL